MTPQEYSLIGMFILGMGTGAALVWIITTIASAILSKDEKEKRS